MMYHHSLNGLKVTPHQYQEALVQKSQLNYTIVRPSAFTDKNPGGKCHVGFDENFKPPKLKILRFEVASFMLKQLEMDQWSGKTVSLSN